MSWQLIGRTTRPTAVTRLLTILLGVALALTGCDDRTTGATPTTPAAVSAPPVPTPVHLTVTDVLTRPIDATRTSPPVLGPTYVAWAVSRSVDGPTSRVVVADLGGGAERTLCRTAYAGGRVTPQVTLGRRLLVVDAAPGPSPQIPDPFVRWRLVVVDVRTGHTRVLARSQPGRPSWPASPFMRSGRLGWTVSTVPQDPAQGQTRYTWRPGHRPEKSGRVRRPDRLPVATHGREVTSAVRGNHVAWTESSASDREAGNPMSLHLVDLRHPDAPDLLRGGPLGYALEIGRGFLLWSTNAGGLRLIPIEGGRTVHLPGHDVPPQYWPDVRGDRVAYVRRTEVGAELAVVEIGR